VHPAFTMTLPAELREKAQPYIGKQVNLGIRPENLQAPRSAGFPVDAGNTLKGIVNVIEPATTGCTVYLSTQEETPRDFVATFKSRLPASYIGKEVPLAVNTRKIHLFDQESGHALFSK
jgi:multiple sugar transport system ATP-binding protein